MSITAREILESSVWREIVTDLLESNLEAFEATHPGDLEALGNIAHRRSVIRDIVDALRERAGVDPINLKRT